MTGIVEWALIAGVFIVALALWLLVPRLRPHVLLRLALTVPLAAAATVLVIGIVFSVFIRTSRPPRRGRTTGPG